MLSGVAKKILYLRRLSGRLPTAFALAEPAASAQRLPPQKCGYANDLLLKEAGTPKCVLANATLSKLAGMSLSKRQIIDRLTDVRPLANLINLNILDLQNDRITNVKPLARLRKLTILELNGDRIDDVKSLAGLSNLGLLDLRNNSFRIQSCPLKTESSVCQF